MMGIQKDIEKLFCDIIDKHQGNKRAAAKSLGVNYVTFWGWIEKSRKKDDVIYGAIDRAGAKLLLPGDAIESSCDQDKTIDRLEKEVARLTADNYKLLTRLLEKYEREKESAQPVTDTSPEVLSPQKEIRPENDAGIESP